MAVNRVSFNTYQLTIRKNLQNMQKQYQQAALPATSGLSLNTLSDKPGILSRVFYLRADKERNEQYLSNIVGAELQLNYADSQVQQALDVVERAKNIALRANDPTVPSSVLTDMQTQISDLKTEFLSYANSQLEGKYIFAGMETATLPFSGTPTAFNGDTNSSTVQITNTLTTTVNLNGSTLFSGSGGGVDIFDIFDDLATAVGTGSASGIATELARIDTAQNQLLDGRTTVGTRTQQLASIEQSLQEDNIRVTDEISTLTDVDISEALSDLVARETALRLVFSVSSRVLSATAGLTLQLR